MLIYKHIARSSRFLFLALVLCLTLVQGSVVSAQVASTGRSSDSTIGLEKTFIQTALPAVIQTAKAVLKENPNLSAEKLEAVLVQDFEQEGPWFRDCNERLGGLDLSANEKLALIFVAALVAGFLLM